MAGAGVNLAITKDGGSYNKLQRPTDYLMSSAIPPPKNAITPETQNSTTASNRKRKNAEATTSHKRTKTEQQSAQDGEDKEELHNTGSGMRAMLPGLDDHEYSSDDDTSEALAYLRNVRSEASTIPNLLVASTSNGHDHAQSERNAIYHQGTWIAVDGSEDGTASTHDLDEDYIPRPQDRQCELLLQRFHRLRATLAAIHENPDTLTTSNKDIPNMIRQLRRGQDWSKLFNKESPKLEFIAQLDQRTMYRALDRCAYDLERARSISPKFSCWIWTLLASTEYVGLLKHFDVGRIRELGQKAGLMGMRLRESGFGAQIPAEDKKEERDESLAAEDEHEVVDYVEESSEAYEESLLAAQESIDDGNEGAGEQPAPDKPVDDGESGADMSMSADEEESQHDEEGTELERARARLLAQLGDRLVQPAQESVQKLHTGKDSVAASQSGRHDSDNDCVSNGGCNELAGYGVELNTKVTIDMILTVVAEYFGQKDLLKYRQQW